MLGREFSQQQIVALLVLCVGVATVQIDTNQAGGSREGGGAGDVEQSHFLGVAAVLTACCTSGFAGFYFEKVCHTRHLWTFF